jgi:hypothetical protein
LKEAIMDKYGYPEDHELERIAQWETSEDLQGLMDYVKSLYREDYGRIREYMENGKSYIELITMGWSGNEDIIKALSENVDFWKYLQKDKSKPGGLFCFEIPGKAGK